MSYERRQAMEQGLASGKQEDFDEDAFPEASFASTSQLQAFQPNDYATYGLDTTNFALPQLPMPKQYDNRHVAQWVAPPHSQPPYTTSGQTHVGLVLSPPIPSVAVAAPSTASSMSAAGTPASAGRPSSSRLWPDGEPRKRQRKQDEDPPHPEKLAAVSLRNPSDALNLLLLATSEGESGPATNPGSPDASREIEQGEADADNSGKNLSLSFRFGVPGDRRSVSSPPRSLSNFPPIQRGIVEASEVAHLFNVFFSKIHPIFPMVPHNRIPKTASQLAEFTNTELHLSTVFILIASRMDQALERHAEIHDRTWVYMKELISNLIFGEDGTVGAVEALLLLSEYQPRVLAGPGNHSKDFAEGNRTSWMLVGIAVRIGYMLALDQRTFTPLGIKANNENDTSEVHHRERLAWTYCFLFDRQVAIRTGKAFWSRGPALMFGGPSADNFPAMKAIDGQQDDFAGLILAYTEITQILQNAHDCLYPSKDRSIALVSQGEYYKYLDEFTKSLNAFRYTWEGKAWETFPCSECVWITFHYVRLYIYGFAFHASVSRANKNESTDPENKGSRKVFERGSMSSPDAKFILEAVEAAADLLRICVDRIWPRDSLRFLPWRFFLYFAYAGTFCLKAVFLNAVVSADRRAMVRLLKRTIECLASTSQDDHHHAVRYARLLNGMLYTFSRGQDAVDLRNSGPRRKLSVSDEPNDWPISRAASPPAPPAGPSAAITAPPSIIPDFPSHFWNPSSSATPTLQSGRNLQVASTSNSGSQSMPTRQDDSLRDFYLTGISDTGTSAQANISDFGSYSFNQSAFGTADPNGDNTFVPNDIYMNILGDTGMDFWATLSNSHGIGHWEETAIVKALIRSQVSKL